MKYHRHYTSPDRTANDALAIADIREYMSQEQWDNMMQLVGNPETPFKVANFCLGITGVEGYPVHAFGRVYMLDRYREWMHEGKNAVPTDEDGFPLARESAA